MTFDHHDLAELKLIVPRSRTCLLGGTFVEHVEGTAPDPAITQAIVDRCARLEPRLRNPKFFDSRRDSSLPPEREIGGRGGWAG